MSLGAADRHGGRRMSLPLLISLFLAALVGVFPVGTTTLATPAAVTTAVERPASLADRTPDVAARDVASPTAPASCPADTEPSSSRHPVVRVLTALDGHAATAPRAPPLLLV